jgi:putative AbiEii toxin of type IV toxin-antitoxin system
MNLRQDRYQRASAYRADNLAEMLTRVAFHRFKQFKDNSFALHPGVSLLGGGNNAGKSSILHGLAVWEFCRTALEMERGAEAFLADYSGQGLGLGDDEFSPINVPSLKHLWTNLKPQRVDEPDGYTLQIRCDWQREGEDRFLEFGLSLANDRLFVKRTTSNLDLEDKIPRLAYLPPFAGMTDREMRTSGAIRRRRIGEGLAGAVLRNILLDMQMANTAERARLRGDKSKISNSDLAKLRATDPWELLQQKLRTTFGVELDVSTFREEYHSYIQIEVVKGEVQGFKVKRYPDYNKRDLMVEGSGFLQWLSVFALATSPDIDILLLDEPDAHLHPSLQVQLLESLRDLAAASDKQTLIATHSTEILRNAEPKDIFQVRGLDSRYLEKESQKVGMLAGMGTDYAPRVDGAKKTKRVLFFEGRSDIGILKILANTLAIPWPDSWVAWQTTQGQKERRQLYLALKDEIPELRALSLRDRDDEPAETVKENLVDNAIPGDPSFQPRRWRRRHIESYLIWPPAIAAASDQSEEQVHAYLMNQHGIAVGDQFPDANAPQALMDVRGKAILADGGPAILGQLSVSSYEVAKLLDADHIPADIKVFLDDVVSLAE